MGDKFFDYQAISNNCQVFIQSCLAANNLLTLSLSTFIKQRTEGLLNDKSRKIVNSITDVAAIGNHLSQKAKEISSVESIIVLTVATVSTYTPH